MASNPTPLHHLRTLALHAQQLTTENGAEVKPDRDRIVSLVKDLLFLQIDTLQMVHRAHYLTIWSRLGVYDTRDLDALVYSEEDRKLYEYWGHAASIMSLDHYKYSTPFMRKRQENPGQWTQRWLDEESSEQVISAVRERIQEEGPLRSADFTDEHHKGGPWWDWKPAKRALEYLFDIGGLMVERREKFQRYYNRPDRVLPTWVDREETALLDAHAFYVEQAAKALGVCRPHQIAEYAYLRRGTVAAHVKSLKEAGVLKEITGVLADGQPANLIIHRDHLTSLEQIEAGEIRADRTTFLNPFDSLFWARGRDQDFWLFTHTLEAYKLPKDRIWGYYSLPILYKDMLIGRFDPKLERKEKRLILRALIMEDGITITPDCIESIAVAMTDFMRFHHAKELVIERCKPAEVGETITRAVEAHI